jgi:hypothetical protein
MTSFSSCGLRPQFRPALGLELGVPGPYNAE